MEKHSEHVGSVLALVQFLDYAISPQNYLWHISTGIKGCAEFLRVMFTELAVD